MDIKDWLAPSLVGVVVGWGLNQLGQWFIFRRDERKAIGRVLSDLLEVQHRLLSVPKAVEMIGQKLKLSADAQTPLKLVLGGLFSDERLTTRYEEAVTLVAGMNPILAFRLRSQDLVGPLLHQLRSVALQDSHQSVAMLAKMEDYLFLREISPHLDQLILELAWEHSWRTWWKTKRKPTQAVEPSEEFWEIIMSQMAAIVQKRPGECSEAELVAFEGLVKKGGEVATEGLLGRIKGAEWLVFLNVGDGTLAGGGALKRPADSYKEKVFRQAKSPEKADDFIFEAGWIVVDDQFRGRKYSRCLLESILKLAGTQQVYATTRENNERMRRTNQRFGLKESGRPYSSNGGDYNVVLYTRSQREALASA